MIVVEKRGGRRDGKAVLREVIQVLQDGQRAFVEIGERVRDESLKRYFLTESLKRARFRAELENELHRQGVGDVHEGGTMAGSMRRAWMELRSRFGGAELALLEGVERGEDETRDAYTRALEQELPMPVHQMLSEQRAHVMIAHDYVRDRREILRMRKAG